MGTHVSAGSGHLQCPFCNEYEVDRLYLASLDMDSCVCAGCGARWEERYQSGDFAGRGDPSSVLSRRRP